MITTSLFDSLRVHLRARGITYQDLARALKMSESAVKVGVHRGLKALAVLIKG